MIFWYSCDEQSNVTNRTSSSFSCGSQYLGNAAKHDQKFTVKHGSYVLDGPCCDLFARSQQVVFAMLKTSLKQTVSNL